MSIIQKPGVFISHIHEDQAISNALEAFIRRVLLGAVEVFNAANRESIRPGDPWRDLIVDRLKNASVTIIIASPQAVSRPWINFEGGGAWVAGNRVVPCCISNMTPSNLPAPLGHLQSIELGDPEGLSTLVQLLADVCDLDSPSGLDYSTEAANFRKLWEEHDNEFKLMNLFTQERGYRSKEALILFKESMKCHHISKWGVVVPLFEGNYDVVMSVRFSERYLGAMAHFLPDYAIDAQNSLNVGVIVEPKNEFEVKTELIWGQPKMQTFQKVLNHVSKELMDKGLHPNSELSVDNVCRRFRDTLLRRAIARTPRSPFRSTIGAVICVVGEDLIITTKGIEHSRMEESETIPHYAVFNKAGIELRQSEGDDNDFGLGDDYYFDKSGFADHPDLNGAISIIGLLYKSRYLSGLYDHRLKYS